MLLQKILLRIIALAIFAIFIAAFISYYNKPAINNKSLSQTFVNDTTGKIAPDSVKLLRTVMSSSKSIILIKEKPFPVRRVYRLKDITKRIRTDTSFPVKKDTFKTLLPKR